MRLLVDFTETLDEWITLLTDLQCDSEYIVSSVYFYDPGVDATFLDELLDSYEPSYSDDIVAYIIRSARDLLRGRIDEFMSIMGYEVNRIVKVVSGLASDTIFAIVDVTPVQQTCVDWDVPQVPSILETLGQSTTRVCA